MCGLKEKKIIKKENIGHTTIKVKVSYDYVVKQRSKLEWWHNVTFKKHLIYSTQIIQHYSTYPLFTKN